MFLSDLRRSMAFRVEISAQAERDAETILEWPHQMRELLARYGFCTRWDRDLPAIGCELSAEIGHATRLMRHLRIVTADRKGTVSSR